jgi:hypothetical protein
MSLDNKLENILQVWFLYTIYYFELLSFGNNPIYALSLIL